MVGVNAVAGRQDVRKRGAHGSSDGDRSPGARRGTGRRGQRNVRTNADDDKYQVRRGHEVTDTAAIATALGDPVRLQLYMRIRIELMGTLRAPCPGGPGARVDESVAAPLPRGHGRRLSDEFRGVFSAATVARYGAPSYEQVGDRPTLSPDFLPVIIERFARQQL